IFSGSALSWISSSSAWFASVTCWISSARASASLRAAANWACIWYSCVPTPKRSTTSSRPASGPPTVLFAFGRLCLLIRPMGLSLLRSSPPPAPSVKAPGGDYYCKPILGKREELFLLLPKFFCRPQQQAHRGEEQAAQAQP